MACGRGSLADSYPAAVALVVCVLVPFLLLSAAVFPLAPLITKSLGLSMPALDVTIGLSDAACAFGTMLAAQFAVHLSARWMLLGYVTAWWRPRWRHGRRTARCSQPRSSLRACPPA